MDGQLVLFDDSIMDELEFLENTAIKRLRAFAPVIHHMFYQRGQRGFTRTK